MGTRVRFPPPPTSQGIRTALETVLVTDVVDFDGFSAAFEALKHPDPGQGDARAVVATGWGSRPGPSKVPASAIRMDASPASHPARPCPSS